MIRALVVILALAGVAAFLMMKRQRAEVSIETGPAWPAAAPSETEEPVPSSANNGS